VPQVWRLFTSGLLTNPQSLFHLVFTLVGLYFLAPDIERRWGARKFLAFFFACILSGNLLVWLGNFAFSGVFAGRFQHPASIGAAAAITGIVTAWAIENAHLRVNLFFVLPVSGRVLLWVTVGFCVLDLVYPTALPEGVFAPFGGLILGLLLAGDPSILRRAYLRTKLALLRRRRENLLIKEMLSPLDKSSASAPKRKRGGSAPPLRVVQGGLDDVLKNRKPPKDKRYLN
jgi:membrane associated rhomboid family serine protease